MANSRVEFFGETLMDVTDTTATPASVTAGKVFYQADGQRAVGTAAYQPKVFEEIVTLTTTWQGTGPYTQTVVTGGRGSQCLMKRKQKVQQKTSSDSCGCHFKDFSIFYGNFCE